VKRLTLSAFAKVNLGLEVLGLRTDGAHELRTLFQSIDLADRIVLEPRPRAVRLLCDDPSLPVDEGNLALRAALQLRRYAGVRRGVNISLEKRIPVAGGLGGGSSDAAAVLMGLDRLWNLGLGRAGLLPLARRLGADVPYFLWGGTALGIGRGDEVYPLSLRIRGNVVVAEGGRPLSTATVFAQVDRSLTPRENSNTIFRFISGYGENGSAGLSVLSNDLEPAALEVAPDLEPRVRKVRELLRQAGSQLTTLSGSGASYFGFFDRAADAGRAARSLRKEGIRAHTAKTLSGERYRGVWDRSLRCRAARAGWSR
jgi:4-diphosphocytidyl-2-C-methyl-D-erythritol kinase